MKINGTPGRSGITAALLISAILIIPRALPAQADPFSLSNEAYHLLESGSYDEAILKYKEYIAAENDLPSPDHEKLSEAMNNIGICYENLQQYPEAVSWLQKALEMDLGNDKKKNFAIRYANLADIYESQTLYDSALYYYDKALDWDLYFGDTAFIAYDLQNVGYIYSLLGNYDTALSLYNQALGLSQQIHDSASMADVYVKLGNLYMRWDKNDQAIQFTNQAIYIDRSAKRLDQMASRLNDLATMYYYNQDFDQAISAYEESLNYATQSNDLDMVAILNNNIGSIYLKLGRLDEAEKSLKEAISTCKQAGKQRELAASYSNMAKVQLARGDYPGAEQLWLESLAITRRLGLGDQTRMTCLYLSGLYEKTGDYRKALECQKEYTSLSDSLFNARKHQQIADFEVLYKTRKKENQIVLLDKENKLKELKINRSRIILGGLGAMVFIIALLAITLIRQDRLKAQVQNMDLEQKLLRSQMNPHFMYNSLANIQEFIWSKDPVTANEYLSSFSRLLRLILENSRRDFVPVEKEIATIQNYLNLQKLRYQGKFEYRIQVDDDIDEEAMLIPPMLAQPFIENSIEHGIKPKKTLGHIDVKFSLHNHAIDVEIRDDGIGITRSMELKRNSGPHKEHASLATDITRERLLMLDKKYRKKIKMEFGEMTDQEGNVTGVRVFFSIPYETI